MTSIANKSIHEKILYEGPGIPGPQIRSIAVDKDVQSAAMSLFHGAPINKKLLFNLDLISAVSIKKDEEFLDDFRREIQIELDHLAENPPKNAEEEVVWKTFLVSMMAFVPFCYPKSGRTFSFPVLQADGTCRMFKYTAEVINLTNDSFYTPFTALGMTSKNPDAPPMLIYLATTYPTGNGFEQAIFADFNPGESVGKAMFRGAQPVLDEWFKGKKHVRVMGMSLGGAESLHTLKRYRGQIGQVDVIKPPGLYQEEWTEKYDEGCPINIYVQPKDFVSKLGFFPTGKNVKMYEVERLGEGVPGNPLASHAIADAGCKQVRIKEINPEVENAKKYRKVLTWMHRYLGPVFIYYPGLFFLSLYRLFSRALVMTVDFLKKSLVKIS